MSNTTTAGGILPVTGATVAGFAVSNWVGFAVLLTVAGAGLLLAAWSLRARRANDRHLGIQ